MKFQRIRLVIVAVIGIFPVVYAADSEGYTEKYRDYTVLKVIEQRIETTKDSFDEEELIYQLGLITKYESVLSDDPQAVYILNRSKQLIIEALEAIETQKSEIISTIGVEEDGDGGVTLLDENGDIFIPEEQDQIRSVNVNTLFDPGAKSSIPKNGSGIVGTEQAQEEGGDNEDETQIVALDDIVVSEEQEGMDIDTDTESFQGILNASVPLDQDTTIIDVQPKTTPYADVQFSIQDLYLTYSETVEGEISPLCTVYYDQIDQIAKRNDFPTSLLVAIRYREHSCIFSNPDNGWGNFQITSHYYEPGEIVRDEFATQIQNFIDFSRAKWDYYDAIQTFGPEPVSLSYDVMDINSIRKHAILYNGVYPDVTLESSWYSNENFTQFRGGRDGVVATVLKGIKWEVENGKR